MLHNKDKIQLFKGDCLEIMKNIPDGSIDMILCDLPYGKTECGWDSIIPFDKLWNQYERIITNKGAIVLFGNQPFTSKLILSNEKLFKYSLIWDKEVSGSFAMAKLRPMIVHEDICIFSKGTTANGAKNNMIYNPIMVDAEEKNIRPVNQGSSRSSASFGERKNGMVAKSDESYNPKKRYPKSILKYSKYMKECNQVNRLHPSQKPVDLLEWLIITFSNKGNTVLDNCMGSGSTGEACMKTNRNFIGIEQDDKYFELAYNRINGYIYE